MKITISSKSFEKLMQSAKNIIDKNCFHKSMTTVNIVSSKDGIKAFACDGYEAIQVKLKSTKADGCFQIKIPLVQYKGYEYRDIEIEQETNTVKIIEIDRNTQNERREWRMWRFETIDEVYPASIEQALNSKGKEGAVCVNATRLIKALKAINKYNTDFDHRVRIWAEGHSIYIENDNETKCVILCLRDTSVN